ncbi:MAG: hypothetical protein VX777_09240 [Chlamydiota bacterium]|nr:hypothetical protein [Chlamydiota bacterium]
MNHYFKYIFFFVTTVISTNSSLSAAGCCDTFFANADFRVGYTYRCDKIDYELEQTCWAIKEDIQDCFDKMTIHQISAFGNFITFDNMLVKGRFNYGWLVDGDSKTTTNIDDLTITRKGCIDGCNVWDATLGFGAISSVDYCGYRITPLVGYSWHYQDIVSQNQHIKIDTFTDLTSGLCITGLEEEYCGWWYGPWIGFDTYFDYYRGWDLFFGVELHWSGYEGEFKSKGITINNVTFDERKRNDCGWGYGLVFNAGMDVELCRGWNGFIHGTYQMWELECGRGKNIDNEIFDIDDFKWNSLQLTIGLRLDF